MYMAFTTYAQERHYDTRDCVLCDERVWVDEAVYLDDDSDQPAHEPCADDENRRVR